MIENYHGPAGSPVLYKDRIFLYQDHEGSASQRAFVAAFDAQTGKTLWETPRSETVGWGTPVVINAGDRDELIVNSQGRVAAYDPATGTRAVDGARHDLRGDSDAGGRRTDLVFAHPAVPVRRSRFARAAAVMSPARTSRGARRADRRSYRQALSSTGCCIWSTTCRAS